MSDALGARADVVTALGAVLPGRVYPYPPTSGRYVTPSIFVEQLHLGGDVTEPVVTFPVWVVSDGAVEAQIQKHDEIVWNVYLALYPLAVTRINARPITVAGLRATVVEADILLDAFTLCGAPPPTAIDFATLTG